MTTLLIANRGEIALRVIRTAAELGLDTVAVYADDDADSPHVRAATRAVPLAGGYLDQGELLSVAAAEGADLLHPGYGFLSESAEFAAACADAGITFVGPSPEVLSQLGDKSAARAMARAAGLPVPAATEGASDLAMIRAFAAGQEGGIMIKALAGGGGRGMRVVLPGADVAEGYRECAAEALQGFGDDALFAEALVTDARHIEVQIVGAGAVVALGDRDCSVQRRHQKLIEVAPAQDLPPVLRRELHAAAATLGAAVGYRGIGTVEFLVAGDSFTFLEVNPRIQVEHTITEEVTGVDLVGTQLAIALGAELDGLGLPAGVTARPGAPAEGQPATAHGIAIQARVNMETMGADGSALPTVGTLTTFSPPTGPGVRVDTFGVLGLRTSARYDSLLAKVVSHVRTPSFSAAVRKAQAALGEFAIDGVATNIGFLQSILAETEFQSGPVHTSYVAVKMPILDTTPPPVAVGAEMRLNDGENLILAPLTGVVVEVLAGGTEVDGGGSLVVLEAMKMQHTVVSPGLTNVVRSLVEVGQSVNSGDPLMVCLRSGSEASTSELSAVDLDYERDDLATIRRRHELTRDAARASAVAKTRGRGRRTARENIADLVDAGSFVEFGPLALAAQRSRRSEEDLIANTPADGMVTGVATINGDLFGAAAAEAVVLSYDYSVLAGTQGVHNHAKTDRMLELAMRRKIPLVLFAEGGGGRPGDTDAISGAGLEVGTFRALGALSGRVPLIAVVSGRCFAGNAALAGTCDVLIATPDANIGMGGPAMIEGGGLGIFRPEQIGPVSVQRANGVIDLVARDEQHAVELAKKYLSYLQGPITEWTAPDPRLSRHAVPENRLRAYDVRAAIEAIADVGSTLELRADYGVGVVTAFIRVEGVAYGLVANSSQHLGGAIDGQAADKLAEFLTLCEEFRIPIVSLCDTPGFMVGPEAEEDATVRKFSKLFIVGARLTVPIGAVILRKGYGLGAMAMTGGSFHAPQFTVAWPTGEIGGMGLEGAVRLGFRKELDREQDPVAKARLFDDLVQSAYEEGKALKTATIFGLDDVIDPADTRSFIRTLKR